MGSERVPDLVRRRPWVLIVPTIAALGGALWMAGAPGDDCPGVRLDLAPATAGEASLCRFAPAGNLDDRAPLLYLPGDRGMRGFAIETAKRLVTWGWDVYTLDTPRWLAALPATATPSEAGMRLAELVRELERVTDQSPAVVGWSSGAGVAILAGADRTGNRVRGIVTVALVPRSPLGWHRWHLINDLIPGLIPVRGYETAEVLASGGPIRLAMIASDHDQYVSEQQVRALFATAREPKRLFLVEARNHRFDGGREAFFVRLQEALAFVVAR